MEGLVRFALEQWFGIASFAGGVLVSYIFYKKACKEKKPVYTITSNKMIVNSVSEFGSLKILYDNQEVPNVTATDVVFWNDGKETIQFDDIASADPIRIAVTEPNEILTARLLNLSSPANKFWIEQKNKTSAEVHFEYLDKGQGGFFQILHTGIRPDDLQLLGSIKGAGTPRLIIDKKKIITLFVVAQILIVFLLGWFLAGDMRVTKQQLNGMWEYTLTRFKDERVRHDYLRKTLDLLETEGRFDIEMQHNYLEALKITNEAAGNDLERLRTILDEKPDTLPYISACLIVSLCLGLLQLLLERTGITAYPRKLTHIDKRSDQTK